MRRYGTLLKQRHLKSVAEEFGLRTLVETGTFRGDMVQAMKKQFDQIYTIELGEVLFNEVSQRFSRDQHVETIHGDSGVELKKLMPRITRPALFWLDGHYSGGDTARSGQDTPVFAELSHIFEGSDLDHVVLIDDARCFGMDPAYPAMNEIEEYVRSCRPDSEISVKHDCIRIFPGKNSGCR